MKLTLVILFWKAVILAIIYRYRNTRPVQVYWAGVVSAWTSIVLLKEPADSPAQYDNHELHEAGENTVKGLIVAAVLLLVALAVYSFILVLS